ncbi:MAG: beta-aspartyl-peptidase, partial [Tissierellia bacterium]|nr:beta-aspartyl-peptidase [Tissierellia bacterium]
MMGLEGVKGVIQEGADADIVIFDEEIDITHVIARGKVAMDEGVVVMKGRFEL